jgi:outer membrane protein insertion porin family
MIFPDIRTTIVPSALKVLACAMLSLPAWAVNPFTVRDIRVEGLQRIEPGTVFASLPLRVGDQYSDDKGAAAIRALFALGLFKDVRLETQGDVLVVVVEERPSVASVEFIGLKEFDKDVLVKALKDVGLSEGRPYDKSLADKAEQELKRQYISRSLYGAQVLSTATPVDRNRVNLTFTITEGGPAKIGQIDIVGNKAFTDETLRDQFNLDTGGWMSWYTKSDRYARTKLNADLEALRSFYLSRGFLEFRIDSTQVAMSPNKQEMAITINITEGERFVISGVRLEGNYLDRADEFKALIKMQVGKPYNAETVAETTKAFTDYFGKFGFAFARVEAKPEIDRQTVSSSSCKQTLHAGLMCDAFRWQATTALGMKSFVASSGNSRRLGTTVTKSVCLVIVWIDWVISPTSMSKRWRCPVHLIRWTCCSRLPKNQLAVSRWGPVSHPQKKWL